MADPYLRERIENWASEFAESDAGRRFPPAVRNFAPDVLTTFLAGAAETSDGLDDVTEADIRRGFVDRAARMDLPASIRAAVPDLCGAFLEDLETRGRLADGRILASFVRAARPAFESSSGVQKTFRRPSTKLSPNAPCPCGSGRKYKKCCEAKFPG